MDYMKIVSEYEIWKIANDLAVEIYPDKFDIERKPDRERLIDFKDKLREIYKNVHEHPHLNHELGLFIKYMNPKRKWTFDDLEILKSLYLIQVRSDDLYELMDAGDLRFENKEEYKIIRFLFESGEYDKNSLSFLYELYEIDEPKIPDWMGEEERPTFDDRIIQRARRLINEEKAEIKFEHLTEAFDEKRADYSAIKAQAGDLKTKKNGLNKMTAAKSKKVSRKTEDAKKVSIIKKKSLSKSNVVAEKKGNNNVDTKTSGPKDIRNNSKNRPFTSKTELKNRADSFSENSKTRTKKQK